MHNALYVNRVHGPQQVHKPIGHSNTVLELCPASCEDYVNHIKTTFK